MSTSAAPPATPCPPALASLFASGAVDAVCLDVDSTVCRTEGIDELAEFFGVKDAVIAVTKQAMEGSLDFSSSLSLRLEAMRLTKKRIAEFVAKNPPQLTPGVASLVEHLRALGIKVFLVSGGFRTLVNPAAEALGLDPATHVIANTFVFPAAGATVGEDDDEIIATFDPSEPTSATGGKARALEALAATHGLKCMVMVGDGVTDLEARPHAAAVIGFGGVVSRAPVVEAADWFVTDFAHIKALLPPVPAPTSEVQ